MKVVAIIQARMGSTRLPGKVLLDLAGEPMLARVVERTRRAETVDEVVVATTVRSTDHPIADLSVERNWACCRGSENDVLDRYYQTAVAHQADVVVRITSDCPLIEPAIVDRVVRVFLDGQPTVHYACNLLPVRTFPRGLDTEVVRRDILERAWREDLNPAWREHVTPYIYSNSELFSLRGVASEVDYSHLRWTVDTREDFAFVRRVYDHFGHACFAWGEVLALLEEHPEWLELNRHVRQKVS